MRNLVYQIKQYINQVDSSKSLMDSIKKYTSSIEDRILKDEENLKHLKLHLSALSENYVRSEKFLKSLSGAEPIQDEAPADFRTDKEKELFNEIEKYREKELSLLEKNLDKSLDCPVNGD